MKSRMDSIRKKLVRLEPKDKVQRIIVIDEETDEHKPPNESITQITPEHKQLTRAELDELKRSDDNIVLLYIRYDES